MKITTFNPSIITNDAEATINLFKELGFEQTHNKAENFDVEFSAHRMKDANGFHVDVVEVPSITKTYSTIRINVDNYEEAYDFFISKGFREAKGFAPSTTKSSKYAYLVSPTGIIIDVCQHIKNHD
jgi:catechol 2,3-dioxygenase-like lactoylglutathione lyase family enzyme